MKQFFNALEEFLPLERVTAYRPVERENDLC